MKPLLWFGAAFWLALSWPQANAQFSGANVNIQAGRDATVAASAVLADQDIVIRAGRNIALDAAANTEASQSQQKSSSTVIGLTPGITGRFTAFGKTSGSETGDTTGTTQSTSLLSANTGNLTLTAGTDAQYRGTGEGNVTAQGAQLLAKGAVRATGNAVDLGAAQDSSTSHSHQESKSLTIGSQLTGAVGGGITRIGDMVQEAGTTSNSRLQGALARKSGYDAYKLLNNAQVSTAAADATSPLAAGGSGIGVSVSISSSKSSQDASQSTTTNRGTSVQAQTIDIQSRDGDINAAGAKLQATDISLDSAGKLNLGATTNTTALSNSSLRSVPSAIS